MKYLIITSLYTSIIVVTTTQSELLPILFSTAGILLLYWLLSHSLAMRKEIAFFKRRKSVFHGLFPKHSYPDHIASYAFKVNL